MSVRRFRQTLILIGLCTLIALSCGITFDLGEPGLPALADTNTPTPGQILIMPTTQRPTLLPNAFATQISQAMFERVQEYYALGYIDSLDGEYLRLPDYSNDSNEVEHYWINTVGLELTNFVLTADLAWESAAITTDRVAGCGLVFHLQDQGHYSIFWGTDGQVHGLAEFNQEAIYLGMAQFGPARSEGQISIGLIVSGSHFRALVDDQVIEMFTGFDYELLLGDIGYATNSATSEDYGIRCVFTNVQIWALGGARMLGGEDV